MERACFLLRIKKDRITEYRKTHEPVWPELLLAIRDAGIRNYSMFLRDDGLLIGYLEADDVQASLKKVGATDVSRRWEERMSPFFEGRSGDRREAQMEWVEQIFHTE